MLLKKKCKVKDVEDDPFDRWMDEREGKEVEAKLYLEDENKCLFSLTIEKNGNHVFRQTPRSRSPDGELRKLEKQ